MIDYICKNKCLMIVLIIILRKKTMQIIFIIIFTFIFIKKFSITVDPSYNDITFPQDHIFISKLFF